MQTYSKYMVIIYVTGILLALTALIGMIFKSAGQNIITSETVLLNPKYAPLVSRITISSEGTNKSLDIQKTGNGYKGIAKELIFPIDAVKVDELIRIARNSITMYKISDSYDTWNSFSIDDLSAIVLSFWGSNANTPLHEFSRLYFGTEDFSGSQISLRTALSPNVYRIQNDFYPFLTTKPSAWSDPKLIPDYLKNGQTEQNASFLSLIQNELKTTLVAGDSLFDSAVYAIFSLRSSQIIQVPPFILNETPTAQVQVQFQDNHLAEFFVYAQDDIYCVVPQSMELRYAIEISEWTYERIINAFKTN